MKIAMEAMMTDEQKKAMHAQQCEYQKANTKLITARVNLNTEPELYEYWKSLKNPQAHLKQLIREDMKRVQAETDITEK